MRAIALLTLITLMIGACSKAPVTVDPNAPTTEYATGLVKDPKRQMGVLHFRAKRFTAPIPAEFDWEAQGFKTPVRNQGSCGSCWAFGGTQTIEMGYKIFGGKDVDFSEQDLVGRLFYGCGGGYFTGKFQVEQGQLGEADCKYTASNKRCPRVPPAVAGKGTSWGLVGRANSSPTVEELQTAIMTYGALSVTVTANNALSRYKGGLDTNCPHGSTNHIVALVGWKTGPDGKVYFHMKNSWGEGWGEKGYGWFRAGCYDLAEEASWLAVDAVPCKPPVVKLPAEYVLNYGDDVVLAVKAQQGVLYSWYRAEQKLGDGPQLELTARESMVIELKAKNQCGEGEVQSLVTVRNP